MKPNDYPASLRMADAASKSAQWRHFALLAGQLACPFAGAVLFGVAGSAASLGDMAMAAGSRNVGAVVLLFSVMLPLVARALRLDAVWWDARAVAESIKTSAWRYMMAAPPFAGGKAAAEIDQDFLIQIAAVRKARSAVAAALERERDVDPAEITETLRANRSEPLDQRRKFYREHRLNDQRRWYTDKARFHDRRREAYFLAALVLQVLALLAGFFDWRPKAFNTVPLLVALAASLTAWAQAKRHEELAQAYALARQELDVMEGRLQAAGNDADFGVAVAETEEAISREHTMWMARRNR